MKQICRNSLNGKCRFGERCRFVHPTVTPLLDPPSWIYTGVEGVDLTEISPDEFRYSLLVGDNRKILDDIWWDNYLKLYHKLNSICYKGIGRSTSNRLVDLRTNPEVFNLPFDLDLIERKLIELRRNSPIVGEGDVVKGEEEDLDGSVPQGGVSEASGLQDNVPGFIREFKEKKMGDNRRYDGGDRRYDNQRYNDTNRRYDSNDSNRRYDSNDTNRRYDSNDSNRRYDYNDSNQRPQFKYNRPKDNRLPPSSPFKGDYKRDSPNANLNVFQSDRTPRSRWEAPKDSPNERSPPKEEQKEFEYKNVPYRFNDK